MADVDVAGIAKQLFEELKIEGKSMKEWADEINAYRNMNDGIVFCIDCINYRTPGKCVLATLVNESGVPDVPDEYDYFFCADGRAKK